MSISSRCHLASNNDRNGLAISTKCCGDETQGHDGALGTRRPRLFQSQVHMLGLARVRARARSSLKSRKSWNTYTNSNRIHATKDVEAKNISSVFSQRRDASVRVSSPLVHIDPHREIHRFPKVLKPKSPKNSIKQLAPYYRICKVETLAVVSRRLET